MQLSHVGIWSANLEETERFCQDVLGFQRISSYEVPGEIMETIFGVKGHCRVQMYGLDDGGIEVFDAPQGVEPGINHFAVSVESKSEFCKQASQKGATVIEVWRADHPVYFLKGPSGTLIEVRE